MGVTSWITSTDTSGAKYAAAAGASARRSPDRGRRRPDGEGVHARCSIISGRACMPRWSGSGSPDRRRRRHPGRHGNNLAQGAPVRSPQIGRRHLGFPHRPQPPHRCAAAQPRIHFAARISSPFPIRPQTATIASTPPSANSTSTRRSTPCRSEQFTLVRLAFFEGLSHATIAARTKAAARHGEVAAAARILALAPPPARCRRDGSAA